MLTGGVFLHSVALCRTLNFLFGWIVYDSLVQLQQNELHSAFAKVPEPDLDAVEAEHSILAECLQLIIAYLPSPLNVHCETNTSVIRRYGCWSGLMLFTGWQLPSFEGWGTETLYLS